MQFRESRFDLLVEGHDLVEDRAEGEAGLAEGDPGAAAPELDRLVLLALRLGRGVVVTKAEGGIDGRLLGGNLAFVGEQGLGRLTIPLAALLLPELALGGPVDLRAFLALDAERCGFRRLGARGARRR